MENEAESKLYQYLSAVGVKRKSPGRIDFNPIDLNRALEFIVADGDNFLLERLYSYATPGFGLILSVGLDHPDLPPDMSGWGEDRQEMYRFNNEVVYQEGDWHHPRCYNPETGKIAKFNPITFQPHPERFLVLDHMEDYRRLYNQVRKVKPLGYRLRDLEIEEPDDLLAHFYIEKDTQQPIFRYLSSERVRNLLGHLIPELE